jgi:uncharacterized lipoprotein YajG
MIHTTSRFRLSVGVALVAGMAVLAGCGSEPYSRTTTSEQSTTTTPAVQPMTTTTTTTDQHSQRQ